MTYNYTLTDTQWRDCRPVYANFLTLRDEVNGLTGDNFDTTGALTVAKVIVASGIRFPTITPGASLDINLAENKKIEFHHPSFTALWKIDSSGVQFG